MQKNLECLGAWCNWLATGLYKAICANWQSNKTQNFVIGGSNPPIATNLSLLILRVQMRTTKYTVETLAEAVKQTKNVAETLRFFGLVENGANYQRFYRFVGENKIDITHFTGMAHAKGRSIQQILPLADILVEHSSFQSGKLKKRLLKEGLVENKCLECGMTNIWNNKPIIFQLDHINGVNEDNRLENLRLLCPNCHSQTTTFAGRNRKIILTNQCCDCGDLIKSGRKRCKVCFTNTQYQKTTVSLKKECLDCCCKITNKSLRCKSCAGKIKSPTKIKWPNKNELQKLVWEMPTCLLAKFLGVSDKAIEKRCKQLEIEKPSRGHWAKLKSQ